MQSNECANMAHERCLCMTMNEEWVSIDDYPHWNPSLAFTKRNWRKPCNQESQFSWCEAGTWWKWDRSDKHTLMLGSLLYECFITATLLPPPPSHWCGLPALNDITVSTFKYNHYLPCTKIVTELKIKTSYHTLQNSYLLLLVSYILQSLDHHLETCIGE